MALVDLVIKVTDTKKAEFESFLKKLSSPQTPVAGDRLFSLAKGTFEQRNKNLTKQKEGREILKKARAQGITA
jgi:hypothetical protein